MKTCDRLNELCKRNKGGPPPFTYIVQNIALTFLSFFGKDGILFLKLKKITSRDDIDLVACVDMILLDDVLHN